MSNNISMFRQLCVFGILSFFLSSTFGEEEALVNTDSFIVEDDLKEAKTLPDNVSTEEKIEFPNNLKNTSSIAEKEQEESLLILVDLEGALFNKKNPSKKITLIQNESLAEEIKSYRENGAKILYLAEHTVDATFWFNTIKANSLPFEKSFSLSNEIFQVFENSIPSCRSGIILCQGKPHGEILGVVLNQLWVRTQFCPKKILFYTTQKQRGKIVETIAERIGACSEIKLIKSPISNFELKSTKIQLQAIADKRNSKIAAPALQVNSIKTQGQPINAGKKAVIIQQKPPVIQKKVKVESLLTEPKPKIAEASQNVNPTKIEDKKIHTNPLPEKNSLESI